MRTHMRARLPSARVIARDWVGGRVGGGRYFSYPRGDSPHLVTHKKASFAEARGWIILAL